MESIQVSQLHFLNDGVFLVLLHIKLVLFLLLRKHSQLFGFPGRLEVLLVLFGQFLIFHVLKLHEDEAGHLVLYLQLLFLSQIAISR